MGPLLFILDINDLPNASLTLSYIICADDTNVSLSEQKLDTLTHNMNEEIQKVNIWYKVNGLRINIEKTNFMHFAPLNKQYDKNLVTLNLKFVDSLEP